ncbi:Kae1-associated serine/threonine protein kinase [Candidatus Woesearchaeota archaeon]|nr:Kae1-associated serine/threonine protein kinase [Candidatus Woesearchaeota archaeon]
MASKKEEWKTYGNVFDNFTLRTLFHMASTGLFDRIESPIALGKESNIFSAIKGDSRVCLKIYRLEACDFTRMYEYIRTDPRYIELKHHKRKIIFSWTQREYRNLLKAREAGVKCPTPYAFENNVLVMEFIGDEKACPQAKNCAPRNAKKFIKDVVDEMRKLHKAGIVHGDLSEYNILNKDGSPVLIDFSHATQKNNPIFGELLERDIKNIARYAKKLDAGFDEEKIKKILGKA